MKWYLKAMSEYVNFQGRARRKEYWMFALFYLIILMGATVLDNIAGLCFEYQLMGQTVSMGYGPSYLLMVVLHFFPALGVAIRRLHDTGRSGWMYLILLIPLIGIIWFLVLLARDSEVGRNKYGEHPK